MYSKARLDGKERTVRWEQLEDEKNESFGTELVYTNFTITVKGTLLQEPNQSSSSHFAIGLSLESTLLNYC